MRRRGKVILWALFVASMPLTVATTAVFVAIFPDKDLSFIYASGGRMISIDTFADRGDKTLEGGFYISARSFAPWPVNFEPRFESGAVEGNTEIPAVDVEKSNRIWIDKSGLPTLRPREAIASENQDPNIVLTPPLEIQTLFAIPFLPALLLGWLMPAGMLIRAMWLRRGKIFDAFFAPRSFT